MSDSQSSAVKSTLIATAASLVGLIVGAFTIYSKMKDAMEEEITRRVKVETRLSAAETQIKANKDDIWTMRMASQRSGQ